MPTTLITSTPPKRIRLDKLAPGSVVLMTMVPDSKREYLEKAIFLGTYGEGDDRKAHFLSVNGSGRDTYTWDAYRYNGHWAFGTSAERLRVDEVITNMVEA